MKVFFKFVTFFVVIATCSVLMFKNIYANEETGSSYIKAEKVAGLVDRFGEKVSLLFKFSKESRAEYMENIVKRRFGELQYVLETEQGDFVEETSSRYSTYVGLLTDYLIKNKLTDRKVETLEMYKAHSAVLEENTLNQNYNSGFWLLLQHDINYLKIYSSQLEQM